MNTEDKPEWPDIIGSGDYKKALSGGDVVSREQGNSPPTQLIQATYELDAWFMRHGSSHWECGAAKSRRTLSGGEAKLRPKGGKVDSVVATHSLPTQLREIAERLVTQLDHKLSGERTKPYDEDWERQQVIDSHILAMQEAWELGYTQCGHDEYFRDPETTEVHKIKAEDTPA